MDQTHFSLFSKEKLTGMRERDVNKKNLVDGQDL
jgi:hypothetical protein